MKDDLIPQLKQVLWTFAAIILAVTLYGVFVGADKDSTDGENERSGMNLYTDALTGCQYLSAGGGLTPRIDSDGEPVCNEDVLK